MYKQVIVVRDDLHLSAGKMSAQVAHASHAAARKADKKIVRLWIASGEKKVVLKVKDLDELKSIHEKCNKMKLPCNLIKDAGLTEVKSGTITALGIGPDEESKINRATGSLPLMK
jgi:PTH2 family peptidyl-tRNA hydrolase